MRERQDRFEEACELIRLLIRNEEPVDYDGRYYRLNQARMSPGSFADLHLLAVTALTNGARLWSRDKPLHETATRLGLQYD